MVVSVGHSILVQTVFLRHNFYSSIGVESLSWFLIWYPPNQLCILHSVLQFFFSNLWCFWFLTALGLFWIVNLEVFLLLSKNFLLELKATFPKVGLPKLEANLQEFSRHLSCKEKNELEEKKNKICFKKICVAHLLILRF